MSALKEAIGKTVIVTSSKAELIEGRLTNALKQLNALPSNNEKVTKLIDMLSVLKLPSIAKNSLPPQLGSDDPFHLQTLQGEMAKTKTILGQIKSLNQAAGHLPKEQRAIAQQQIKFLKIDLQAHKKDITSAIKRAKALQSMSRRIDKLGEHPNARALEWVRHQTIDNFQSPLFIDSGSLKKAFDTAIAEAKNSAVTTKAHQAHASPVATVFLNHADSTKGREADSEYNASCSGA